MGSDKLDSEYSPKRWHCFDFPGNLAEVYIAHRPSCIHQPIGQEGTQRKNLKKMEMLSVPPLWPSLHRTSDTGPEVS